MSTNLAESPVPFFLDSKARRWVGGFFLLGTLIGPVGSLLIVWQYHVEPNPYLIGLHFLGVNAGYVIGIAFSQRVCARAPVRILAAFACVLAMLTSAALVFAYPPAAPELRLLGLGLIGLSAGVLTSCLLSALYEVVVETSILIVYQAVILFGCGNLVATAIIGLTFFVAPMHLETLALAVVPCIYLVLFATNAPPQPKRKPELQSNEKQLAEASRSLRSISGVLFSTAVFLQFGNEWAVAGWLPLFLIRRFGTNPEWAVWILVLYFFVLTFSRFFTRGLLARVGLRKLLFGSVAVAITGCLDLSLADTLFSAWIDIVLVAIGFAPVYPVVMEALGNGSAYAPEFYYGVFSMGMTGAMTAPWLLGFVDAAVGIGFVMFLPALGCIAVLICALLLILESHLMSDKRQASLTEFYGQASTSD